LPGRWGRLPATGIEICSADRTARGEGGDSLAASGAIAGMHASEDAVRQCGTDKGRLSLSQGALIAPAAGALSVSGPGRTAGLPALKRMRAQVALLHLDGGTRTVASRRSRAQSSLSSDCARKCSEMCWQLGQSAYKPSAVSTARQSVRSGSSRGGAGWPQRWQRSRCSGRLMPTREHRSERLRRH
jgi:hypothetical protein